MVILSIVLKALKQSVYADKVSTEILLAITVIRMKLFQENKLSRKTDRKE
jgi:hypothetical protein